MTTRARLGKAAPGRPWGTPLLALGLAVGCDAAMTNQGYEPVQPIAYSHAQHAGELKIDCLYCHFGAEKSRHAGVPPVSVCMNCHEKVRTDSPEIQKLAAAFKASKPVEWVKVHRLPDFAYFNHARHVVGGKLACQTCHGPVETMTRVRQAESLSMGWCLGCHRGAEGHLQPEKGASSTDCSSGHL